MIKSKFVFDELSGIDYPKLVVDKNIGTVILAHSCSDNMLSGVILHSTYRYDNAIITVPADKYVDFLGVLQLSNFIGIHSEE